jgi:hypothetical protein
MVGETGKLPRGRDFERRCWICGDVASVSTAGEHQHKVGERALRAIGWRYLGISYGPMLCPTCVRERARLQADTTNQQLNESMESPRF